jgi:hypothetical protein
MINPAVECGPMRAHTCSKRSVFWSIILCANLVVPLYLAFSLTKEGGRLGIAIAILCYWMLGLIAIRHSHRFGSILLSGGFIIGLSQFWPVLQAWAGVAALEAWHKVHVWTGGAAARGRPLSEFDGFAVTTLTGAMLLTATLFCGTFVTGLLRLGLGETHRAHAFQDADFRS